MLEMQSKASPVIPRVEPQGKEIQEDDDELECFPLRTYTLGPISGWIGALRFGESTSATFLHVFPTQTRPPRVAGGENSGETEAKKLSGLLPLDPRKIRIRRQLEKYSCRFNESNEPKNAKIGRRSPESFLASVSPEFSPPATRGGRVCVGKTWRKVAEVLSPNLKA
ncbi:hypothetical protein MA16_Dca002047 [Dendrobium catenatum]|uniref:Uncharacterized protein n=1 Tax=Dendrobium catenatum TaxID=906689 RepID=A0A2I0XE73_9ASPA|nr:hypothetical protein MA16_Dca002047 [Dendrobium catenatum]